MSEVRFASNSFNSSWLLVLSIRISLFETTADERSILLSHADISSTIESVTVLFAVTIMPPSARGS